MDTAFSGILLWIGHHAVDRTRLEKENINKISTFTRIVIYEYEVAQVLYFHNGPIYFSNGLCRKSERSCVADGTNFGPIWMSKLEMLDQ